MLAPSLRRPPTHAGAMAALDQALEKDILGDAAVDEVRASTFDVEGVAEHLGQKLRRASATILNRFAQSSGPYCIPVATCCVLLAIGKFYGGGSWFNQLGRGGEE